MAKNQSLLDIFFSAWCKYCMQRSFHESVVLFIWFFTPHFLKKSSFSGCRYIIYFACPKISSEGHAAERVALLLGIISLSPGLVAENNMKSKQQQHIFLALFLKCFLLVVFYIRFGQGSALSGELFEANLNKKWDSTPLKTLKLSVELCQVSSQSLVFLWNIDFTKKKVQKVYSLTTCLYYIFSGFLR